MRNFETNMFQIGTASTILVRLLATWSIFVDQRQNYKFKRVFIPFVSQLDKWHIEPGKW